MSQDITQLIAELHPLERKVLSAFKASPTTRDLWDNDLLNQTDLDESRLSMAMGWLQAKNLIVPTNEETKKWVKVTELGDRYLSEGLPGLRIVDELKNKTNVTISALRGLMEPNEVSKAIGALKDCGEISIRPGGVLEVSVSNINDSKAAIKWHRLVDNMNAIKEAGILDWDNITDQSLRDLVLEYASGRGKKGIFDINEKRTRSYRLTKLGESILDQLGSASLSGEEIAQLTPDLLKDGAWRGKSFRKYNIGLKPSRQAIGRKHPYRTFLDEVKAKLVSMGFEEMRGPLVESEFWNSDALYMPQFHPARDIHDVYFVSQPRSVSALPEPMAAQVAQTHQAGWKTGSRGWRYEFSMERAKRLVLRSQGTSVSARTLAAKPKIPGRYFSIARCFRYDLVDATHAPDFFQVEGIALGEAITFRTLLGLLKLFATEMARATEVRYLPAYFPYTEPSVEMHVRHPKLGWMELGGAGMFRPEVTVPLGVTVPVIAWGLGLDRMAMVALGIHDIRDLFSSDLELIRTKQVRE